MRRFHQLPLERKKVTFFPLTWTIVHPIDKESPLYGLTREECVSAEAEILVLLTGIEEIFSQNGPHTILLQTGRNRLERHVRGRLRAARRWADHGRREPDPRHQAADAFVGWRRVGDVTSRSVSRTTRHVLFQTDNGAACVRKDEVPLDPQIGACRTHHVRLPGPGSRARVDPALSQGRSHDLRRRP